MDGSKATFTPYQWYGINDIDLWNSRNPYGAVISIDIAGPDNDSVVVTKVAPNGWTFTTIHDP